jgi:hypothetical protein
MSEPNEIIDEQVKRDRHCSEAQRRQWADQLLSQLPSSLAYQQKCTPQARLKEQAELLEQLEHWQNRHASSIDDLAKQD